MVAEEIIVIIEVVLLSRLEVLEVTKEVLVIIKG